ncbi:ABC transporter ATP-binding protein [Frondihabitans australicus]|uniref:ABC-type Fe3+/spermidine/putrescine transport system ATPase subunit n=1 Tax=Frondihabitans australicus TaxID=386892 RepID=A0A495IC94_9MICO|nr:ABC transporter ATP-binding protein [Frondihabitans australicus]RKR73539.1 ABC-type Fe3+/spermidine/putrescine transport system ATPase subunit [Frondihabitans australicus]
MTVASETSASAPGGAPAPSTTAGGAGASSGAAVRLDGIGRRFGDSVAVERIDLELAPGEFFALLGPSGCGKTTTLRMVGGFETPSYGRISLGGRDVTDLPPYRRDVNTVFQSYALFPHLSVFDNVAFGLRRTGVAKGQIKERVNRYLEMVGLHGFGRRTPGQLSGGQQQRVALARALVNEPKVLLLDEPMGALDARIRKTMQVELKRIQREVGITFLYVTHDQSEAMAMADRLAVMNKGIAEDIGTPDRVYDRPATHFVADFLGTCNLLPAPSGTTERLGIRPEKLHLHRVAEGAGAGAQPTGENLHARVETATYFGASSEYVVRTANGDSLIVYAQNVHDSARAHEGDDVEVSWAPEHAFPLPDAPAAA